MHGIIELVKMFTLTAKNYCNFCAHWIINISLVLYSAHVISENHDEFAFYVNNYIY